jgi:hypothetical protein
VRIQESRETYADVDSLASVYLIMQCYTMGTAARQASCARIGQPVRRSGWPGSPAVTLRA